MGFTFFLFDISLSFPNEVYTHYITIDRTEAF